MLKQVTKFLLLSIFILQGVNSGHREGDYPSSPKLESGVEIRRKLLYILLVFAENSSSLAMQQSKPYSHFSSLNCVKGETTFFSLTHLPQFKCTTVTSICYNSNLLVLSHMSSLTLCSW